MNIPEYNTELDNNIVSNLANIAPGSNESSLSIFDYLYDSTDNNINDNGNYTGGPQHLATILQQLFSKMSDNQTIFNIPSSSSLSSASSTGILSRSSLPASSNDPNSHNLLSTISLWFVLIVNPIVILFGVIGNLLATYILINGNVAKLPVSFYTIMLNISDTLNLLIPVFIFWLDNCFNRTPERGYFRDRSNFLCKALMCPDQLFAALSAWYMCAISFNRWCSVCRPSSYFFQMASNVSRLSSSNKECNRGEKTNFFGTSILSSISFCFRIDRCFCLTRNIKYRQHLQAFRSIGIITLLGILCCLYPIFMHELRPVILTNRHLFDLTQKITHTYAVIWKRCYYSQRHEYAYDIIGIILSSVLHILPLTSVAAMNIMIIVRLRKRRGLMSPSKTTKRSTMLNKNKGESLNYLQKPVTYKLNSSSHKAIQQINTARSSGQPSSSSTYKDQETSTESPIHIVKSDNAQVIIRLKNTSPRRHLSRDRTITIMLVSVALSYLMLTLPYRLFWSYNVYIKRMYPDKLNSSDYLLQMHYIDHVLRTIRNIHYCTNFIFFIFLSTPFRQKFIEIFSRKSHQLPNRTRNNYPNKNIKTNYSQEYPAKLDGIDDNNQNLIITQENNLLKNEYSTKNSYNETPSLIDDDCTQKNVLYSIV